MKRSTPGLTRIGDLLADILPAEVLDAEPSEPRKPVVMSKRQVKRSEGLERIRLQRQDEKQQLGYLARPFILCGLPFKPKKGTAVFKRVNGDEVLEIHGSPDHGLPFGGDIQVLVWVSTLAVKAMAQNGGRIPRVIQFRSGADFLKAFDLPLDGASYKRARDRFLRIFYATFFWGHKDAKRERLFRAHFFDSIDLWFSRDLDTDTLPGDDFVNNRIVLSESFAADLERHHPPIELSAVAEWSDSPAQLYFYLWLVFRCYMARERSVIPLMGKGSVYEQCGAEGYADPDRGPRNFRMRVKKWLGGVKLAWPDCPVRLMTSPQGDALVIERHGKAIHQRRPKITPL